MTPVTSHLDPELLSAYLDDQVSVEERARIEMHLPSCEACQLELESLAWTVSLLGRLPTVDAPRNFYVTEAMLAPDVPPSLWERLVRQWRPLLGTAATVTALFLAVILTQSPFSGEDTAATSAPVEEVAVMVEPSELPDMPAAESAEEMSEAAAPVDPGLAQQPETFAADEGEAEARGVTEAPAEEVPSVPQEASAAAPSDPDTIEAAEGEQATSDAFEEAAPEVMQGDVTATGIEEDAATISETIGETGMEEAAAEESAPGTAGDGDAPSQGTPAPEEAPDAEESRTGDEAEVAPPPANITRIAGWILVAMLLVSAAALFYPRRR